MNLRALFMFFVITVCACTRDNEPSLDITGSDYFPLERYSYIIYDVDSVSITQNTETFYKYQLMVSIEEEPYVNAEGNTAYVLQRQTRADETKPWKPAGTWTAWKTGRQAVVTEGNTSYIKLQFPVSVGLGWNGNGLNNQGGADRCNGADCDRYEVTSIDPSIEVTQSNEADVLAKDVRVEKYQQGIGLIYKESEVYQYCEGGDCFGKDFVIQGLRYKMEIKENGTLNHI
jgi:hypothetical protein